MDDAADDRQPAPVPGPARVLVPPRPRPRGPGAPPVRAGPGRPGRRPRGGGRGRSPAAGGPPRAWCCAAAAPDRSPRTTTPGCTTWWTGSAWPTGWPSPTLYVIDDAAPNAFVVGRSADHASLAVTQGLLDVMSRVELEAVIAHELSRIKDDDVLVDTLAVTMPVTARLVHLVMGRGREPRTDMAAVAMTRFPPALASALTKMRDGGTVGADQLLGHRPPVDRRPPLGERGPRPRGRGRPLRRPPAARPAHRRSSRSSEPVTARPPPRRRRAVGAIGWRPGGLRRWSRDVHRPGPRGPAPGPGPADPLGRRPASCGASCASRTPSPACPRPSCGAPSAARSSSRPPGAR